MGAVLIALRAAPGQEILEYGAGEGGIAIEAAKAGCTVAVVDIEPRYLRIIERRAKAAGVEVKTFEGEFGYDCGGTYDRILFYEAFHHALEHQGVARKLHGMLKPDGFLVFAGEPIIGAHNQQWRDTLPYPWGVRLDGLSFRSIQTYGWMELGFDQAYFVEMLMRAGFQVEFHRSTATDRGSAYIARPFTNVMHVGANCLLEVCGRPIEWHEAEGTHRWTAAEEATLPLRDHKGEIVVEIANYCAGAKHFEVCSGDATVSGTLGEAEVRSVALQARQRLYIRSPLTRLEGPDTRAFGLAVRTITYL